MMKREICVLFLSSILYAVNFSIIDDDFKNRVRLVQTNLPVEIQEVVGGYLKQLISEVLFVKTSVFLGGGGSTLPKTTYSDTVTTNFEVMTSLYPQFKDPYYYVQSFLAPISKSNAERANNILKTGIMAYPNELTFHFFYAFNFYDYLKDPLKASQAFARASIIPNSPPMFEHLAAILAAEGGEITAGLVMLKAMLAIENNEATRARYQEEITVFKRAIKVQNALRRYIKKLGHAPDHLKKLVPDYLEYIPENNKTMMIVYDYPVLKLVRP